MHKVIFYLAIEIIVLAAGVILWRNQMKPALWGPFTSTSKKKKPIPFFKNPDVLILIIGVAIGIWFCAVLAYSVPPNNNDSISTHAVRLGYWLQNGNYRPWETNRLWQIIYPVNAQLVMYWTLLFSGSDHWVAFVQFSGGIIAALSVVGIAKEFVEDQPVGAIFSGLIFLTLPAVVLQMTTTQNDLITAAFVGLGFYFFVYAFKHEDRMHFIFSGGAIGIAMGIKQTLFFLLPGWGIACLVLWLVYKRVTFKQLMVWGVSILVAFLLLGSQMYIINFIEYGSPFGPKEVVDEVSQATDSIQTAVTQVGLNSLRFLYQFADSSGLPRPFWYYGNQVRAFVAKMVFGFLNLPLNSECCTAPGHQFGYDQVGLLLHEDEAWYGLLGFFALVPTLVTTFVWGLRKKEPLPIVVLIITAGFFLFVTLLRPGWDPYQGRYFMPLVLLCTSLNVFWFTKKIGRWMIGPLSVIIGLLIMFNAVLYNPAKPMMDTPLGFYYKYIDDPGFDDYLWYRKQNILEYSRNEQISYQTRGFLPICEIIEEAIPVDTVMGYMINSSYYQEYCFFGEKFERVLVPLEYEDMEFSQGKIVGNGVEYILYYQYDLDDIPPIEGFQLFREDEKHLIYIFSNE
jgi:hypothetical protein